MEYLTLHDIPQRHCNPVHSHRMTSQSSERPVGRMVAVCKLYSFVSTTPSDLPQLVLPPPVLLVSYAYATRSNNEAAQAQRPPLPLRGITLPDPPPVSLPTAPPPNPPGDSLFRTYLESQMNHESHKRKPDSQLDSTLANTLPCSEAVWDIYVDWCNAKTARQNHLQRSSPPLQPGETTFPGKLPSFDEVSTVRSLKLHYADPYSLSKQRLRGPHHTHHHGETCPQRTLRMCAHSSMM